MEGVGSESVLDMAGNAAASGDERSLEFTPTWALATVSSVFVIISFVVERSLHGLGGVCFLPLLRIHFLNIVAVIELLMIVNMVN